MPSFVDVDFPAEAPFVFGDLGKRAFDDVARGSYGDVVNVIPESKWKDEAAAIQAAGGGCSQLVSRIYNQGNEGSCHSADTEVLTESGWVGWPDYNWSDRLGTMNPISGLLEFQSPLQKHIYDHDGEMFYSSNRSIDFAVTGNHRMFVRRWDERKRTLAGNYDFIEASRLGWYVGLPHATSGFLGTELVKVAIDGDRQYSGDDFAAFLGVVVSDGWAGDSENTRNRASFCCFNEERQPMIRELAGRLGFMEQPGRPGVWYRQNAPALAAWLRANIYNPGECCALDKRVPLIVKAASQRQIELFLKFFGDKSHTREYGNQYYTSSEFMANDLQELSLRVGKRASINKREPRTSHIKGRPITDHGGFVVTEWGGSNLSLERKKQIETERYCGPVYCATVPNGTLVTRRNKSVLISGNCVANACSQAHEIIQAKQSGKENVVHLSAISLYKRIGSSPNSGAMVSDGLEEMSERGVLPLDTPENRAKFGPSVMPNAGFRTAYPSGWEATAKKFAASEWFVIESVNELITALLNQHPVVVGRSGHSIAYCDVVYDGSNLMVGYCNSWGSWGSGLGGHATGFGFDSLRLIRSSASWAFALRSVTVNP